MSSPDPSDIIARLMRLECAAVRHPLGQTVIDDFMLREVVHELVVLRKLLFEPPTWLCEDCRGQWIARAEATKLMPP